MACNTPDCLPSTPAGAGLQVVNTPSKTCTGQTFCDDRLEGLPFANQLDLVGVPEGQKCLHRLGTPAGVWQHDPARPGGADFAGPIGALKFQPGLKMGEGECGFVPMLRSIDPTTVEIVAQDLKVRSDGDLGMITRCAGGKARFDVVEPEAFDEDNPCEVNLSFLGYVLQTVIEGGVNTTKKVWKQITRLLFPATQLSTFTAPDYADGVNWRRAAWKKVGGCWELGLPPADVPVTDCSALASTGAEFQYLKACDEGVEKKVEPTLGMVLVGNGTKWVMRKLGMTRIPRYFVGQKNAGFTTTTNIVGVTDTTGVTSGQQSGNFDMNVLPGYLTGQASIAWVRTVTIVNTVTAGEALAQVKCNGEVLDEAWIDSAFVFGYKINPPWPVALTADIFTFELVATAANPVTNQAWCKLEIIGWE